MKHILDPKQIFCSLMDSDETKGSNNVVTITLEVQFLTCYESC